MRFNRGTQYGFLFALYLSRAGQARVEDVAINLNISKAFLEQVARKLRIAGVVTSVRGPGGGYALKGEPTMGQIVQALDPGVVITWQETIEYSRGQPEARAFGLFTMNMQNTLNQLFRRTVRNVGMECVANEMATLERAEINERAN
jgi:Rrf2 family protein